MREVALTGGLERAGRGEEMEGRTRTKMMEEPMVMRPYILTRQLYLSSSLSQSM